MAGLLQLKNALVQKQAQQQGRVPPQGQADPNQLTPEEQQALEGGVEAASKMLYEDPVISKKVALFIKNPPFHDAIGDAAAMLTVKADESVAGELPETVVIPLGKEILEMVADLGEELGFFKVDDKLIARAAQTMLRRLFEDYGVDEGEVRGLAASGDAEVSSAVQSMGQFNADQDQPRAGAEPPLQQPQPEQQTGATP